MLCTKLTPTEINRANAKFWQKRRALFLEGMANPAAYETAVEMWQQYQPHSQLSFDSALEYTLRAVRRYATQRAVAAGSARKTDALQVLIEQIVQHRPKISKDDLFDAIKAQQGIGIIQDIDNIFIHFTNHHGETKKARISGLKDRLTRAKKKTKSR